MKAYAPFAIGSLMLLTVALGNVTPSEVPAVSEDQKSPAYIEARLQTIKVTDFNIDRITLSSALEQLDLLVEDHGLQILYRPAEKKKEPMIDLKTRSLSLHTNLSLMCRQAGYGWWVENGVIIVGAGGTNDSLVTEIIPIHSATASRLAASTQVQR